MSRLDVRGQLRRVVDAAELSTLRGDADRIASLEVAVAENAALAVPLERVVSDLEATVITLLAREDGRNGA